MVMGQIQYGSATLNAPAETCENLLDVVYGLDRLNGKHVFVVAGDENDPTAHLLVAPGVPLSVTFPAGYKTPDEREDYVNTILERRARVTLGLPLSEETKTEGDVADE